MSVRICIPSIDGLLINAPTASFKVAPNTTIKSGDLLYKVVIDDSEYITNIPITSNVCNAVAILDGGQLDTISCYFLQD